MESRRPTVVTFPDIVTEAGRLEAMASALRAQGLQLGRWIAASRYAAVFEVAVYRGAPPAEPMVAKLPWLLGAPLNDHHVVGAGPNLQRQVSMTGPFVLEAPATEEDTARLIEVPAAHQRACGVDAPLPRLIELLTVGGRPVALYVRVQGRDLAWTITHWPGRARRLLPRVARAVLDLHRSYGPHGDLKPEHVLGDFTGEAPLLLIDPLGPLTGGIFGSFGWQLPLPNGAAPRLADLIALAQVVAACWGDGLAWDASLANGLCNLHNGRFSGASPADLRGNLPTALPKVPAPWRAWALDSVDALFAAWESCDFVGDGRAHDERWIEHQIEALAVLPPWVGDDRG